MHAPLICGKFFTSSKKLIDSGKDLAKGWKKYGDGLKKKNNIKV